MRSPFQKDYLLCDSWSSSSIFQKDWWISLPSYLIDTNTLVPYKCQVPSVQSDRGSSSGRLSCPGLNLNVSPEAAKSPFTYFSSFPVQRVMSEPASHRTLEHRCLLPPQPTSVMLTLCWILQICVSLCLTRSKGSVNLPQGSVRLVLLYKVY